MRMALKTVREWVAMSGVDVAYASAAPSATEMAVMMASMMVCMWAATTVVQLVDVSADWMG